MTSIVFALLGAVALQWPQEPVALVAAAACVQLRLLANLLDGMVAIEGGKQSPVGALYNEIPDRIADSLFLVALGYAALWPTLGWFVALAAAVTAYIRVLGGSLGLPQDFRGPQAKPHRMFVMTVALLAAAAEIALGFAPDDSGTLYATRVAAEVDAFAPSLAPYALQIGLWIIAIGTTLTCVTRSRAIARQLRDRATASAS